MTYNDPVVFHEYAIDVAQACRERGIKSVAVTAGYVCEEPRAEFYRYMDAANVDLKGFTERFYKQICAGQLQPVLDTLVYLKHHTNVWFEITTLLIPGENDSEAELEALTQWVVDQLGPDVPLHFTAFHPDWKMLDKPHTPPATLTLARDNHFRIEYNPAAAKAAHAKAEVKVDDVLAAYADQLAHGGPITKVLPAEEHRWIG